MAGARYPSCIVLVQVVLIAQRDQRLGIIRLRSINLLGMLTDPAGRLFLI
jgi:hypothetical protein